jgi:hypothetical protein
MNSSILNVPSVNQVNLVSLKARRLIVDLLLPLGNLDLTNPIPNPHITATIRASSRIAHLYPNLVNAALKTRGNVTPPSPAPAIAVPIAIPTLRSNQCGTAAIAAVLSNAAPVPVRTPSVNIKCQ